MTDRKPALRPMPMYNGMNEHVGMWLRSSDIPPAILNATKEELAALAVFAEAMPELLEEWNNPKSLHPTPLVMAMNAALAAAKSTTT